MSMFSCLNNMVVYVASMLLALVVMFMPEHAEAQG